MVVARQQFYCGFAHQPSAGAEAGEGVHRTVTSAVTPRQPRQRQQPKNLSAVVAVAAQQQMYPGMYQVYSSSSGSVVLLYGSVAVAVFAAQAAETVIWRQAWFLLLMTLHTIGIELVILTIVKYKDRSVIKMNTQSASMFTDRRVHITRLPFEMWVTGNPVGDAS